MKRNVRLYHVWFYKYLILKTVYVLIPNYIKSAIINFSINSWLTVGQGVWRESEVSGDHVVQER